MTSQGLFNCDARPRREQWWSGEWRPTSQLVGVREIIEIMWKS